MLKLFEDKDAEAVILGTRVSEDAATNFGCIVSDAHSRRVLHYVEKPESHISNLINCGVYLFATETIFPSIRSAIKKRADRPRLVSYPSSENLESSFFQDDDEEQKSTVLRLEQDILSDMADSKQFYVYETKDFWRQIKTAGSAVPANALYLQKAWQTGSKELATPSANILPPVFIHPTATVDPTAKLGPNVSIGPRVTVGAGVRIKESIVLEDSEIKHDACVLYSIIGWNSRVGAWARVEGTPTPVNSHTTSIIKNGVKVQSITILGKECGVGDEVRVQNCVCLPFKELKRVSCSKNRGVPKLIMLGREQRGYYVEGLHYFEALHSRAFWVFSRQANSYNLSRKGNSPLHKSLGRQNSIIIRKTNSSAALLIFLLSIYVLGVSKHLHGGNEKVGAVQPFFEWRSQEFHNSLSNVHRYFFDYKAPRNVTTYSYCIRKKEHLAPPYFFPSIHNPVCNPTS